MAIVYYSLRSVLSRSAIVKEWELYNGYTIRLLPSTINFYKQIIMENMHKKSFLMYGPNPEIRNIFQELNLSVVVIDKSEATVRATGELTKSKKPISANELFVNLDSFAYDFFHQKFDLIIIDDVINMIDELHFLQFLRQTLKLLNTDGLFICHLFFNSLNKLNKFKPKRELKNDSSQICISQMSFEKIIQKYCTIQEIFYSHDNKKDQSQPIYIFKKNEKIYKKCIQS